jgi:hypothetical protein
MALAPRSVEARRSVALRQEARLELPWVPVRVRATVPARATVPLVAPAQVPVRVQAPPPEATRAARPRVADRAAARWQ